MQIPQFESGFLMNLFVVFVSVSSEEARASNFVEML
jgi:hypothetical protein